MVVEAVGDAVNNVLENLDKDSEDAKAEAKGNPGKLISLLYEKVVSRLAEDGYTIAHVLENEEARGKFLAKYRLQAVAALHKERAFKEAQATPKP